MKYSVLVRFHLRTSTSYFCQVWLAKISPEANPDSRGEKDIVPDERKHVFM